jgi:hypothetical protein
MESIPETLANHNNVPDELKRDPHWMCWRYEKGTKVPKLASTTSVQWGSSTNTNRHRSFEEALEAYKTGMYEGIARAIMHEEPYVGIDLDDCVDPETGEIATWAQEIIDGLDSYAEISPTGTGVKMWLRAELEQSRETKQGGKAIEIYPNGRFFTVTGQSLNGSEVKNRQLELDALIAREWPSKQKSASPEESEFNLGRYLDWAGVEIVKDLPDRESSVKYEIECPWAEEHTDGGSVAYVGQYEDGATWFNCYHAHCEGRRWQTFREEMTDRRRQQEREERAAEAWDEAADIARADDITGEFAELLHSLGVAGESKQLRIIYLALTSRFLKKMVNLAIKGPSSSGKSYILEQVLEAFSESAYFSLTSMSERALIYMTEDMRHRFLIIYEASGMAGDMQTYLIRTLLSEGEIKYQTVESIPGKGIVPKLLHREGPTGLIVTTTQTRMHPENETRIFSINVTDTKQQTADILMAIADEDRDAVSMEQFHALQTWLEGQNHEVAVHYAKTLASLIPPVAVRLRRDFLAVLQMIKTHAILHQARRETDDDGRILATHKDYEIVYELMHELVSEGVEAAVPETVRETVEAVRLLVGDEDAPEDADGNKYVTGKAVRTHLNLDRAPTSRRIRSAMDAGYLKNLETRKYQPQKLVLGDEMPSDIDILPTPETLAAECGCAVAQQKEGGHGLPGFSERGSTATIDTNNIEHTENGHVTHTEVHPPLNHSATAQPQPRVEGSAAEGRVVTARKHKGEYVNDFDVYIGHRCTRGGHNFREDSPWANPWAPALHAGLITRREACEQYLIHVLSSPELMRKLPELRGKILACWCAPKLCHGHVLLRLAGDSPKAEAPRGLIEDVPTDPGEFNAAFWKAADEGYPLMDRDVIPGVDRTPWGGYKLLSENQMLYYWDLRDAFGICHADALHAAFSFEGKYDEWGWELVDEEAPDA